MGQRRAVTKTIATRSQGAYKAAKGTVLNELCATTSWNLNHARKALGQALRPTVVGAPAPRAPSYGPEVKVGAVRDDRQAARVGDGRTGTNLRRFDELTLSEETAVLLVAMSPATIDRRLAGDRASLGHGDTVTTIPVRY